MGHVSCGAERARAPDRHAVHAILVPNLGTPEDKIVMEFSTAARLLDDFMFLNIKSYVVDVLTPTF